MKKRHIRIFDGTYGINKARKSAIKRNVYFVICKLGDFVEDFSARLPTEKEKQRFI
jgi:hypothetical protein